MTTQHSLFDLFETAPADPKSSETPQPAAANDTEVQRRIQALVPCRACPRRTSREWATFSDGLCMACSRLESEDWLAERRRARRMRATR